MRANSVADEGGPNGAARVPQLEIYTYIEEVEGSCVHFAGRKFRLFFLGNISS